jgi:transposase
MDKEDARYQTMEQLHERRKQVVRLHRKGYGVMRIVELSGLSYPTVRGVINRYEQGGVSTIRPVLRGKRVGAGRSLTDAQARLLQQIICDRRPEQLKMDFALWSRAAVMQLIERECGIQLSVRGVGNYSYVKYAA